MIRWAHVFPIMVLCLLDSVLQTYPDAPSVASAAAVFVNGASLCSVEVKPIRQLSLRILSFDALQTVLEWSSSLSVLFWFEWVSASCKSLGLMSLGKTPLFFVDILLYIQITCFNYLRFVRRSNHWWLQSTKSSLTLDFQHSTRYDNYGHIYFCLDVVVFV